MNNYEAFGLGLIIFGISLATYSYEVLLNVPFTTLGLACLILGATLLQVPDTPVPTTQIRAMMEGACVNIEALLEEFNANEKAVYLPPRNDRVYAFVPLSNNPGVGDVNLLDKAPLRVITEAGGEPGLIIFPPGSEVVRLSLLSEESGVEEALNFVLVDFLEAVESVKAVEDSDRIVVEMNSPRVETDFPRFERVLGSVVTSVAGCVISRVLGKPVIFEDEEVDGDRVRGMFRVASVVG